jgi:hypothetical protein
MTTDIAKYKDDPLLQLLGQLYLKNNELKELMHTNVIKDQGDRPTRRNMVSRSKKYTDLKDTAIRLIKMEAKNSVDKKKRPMKLTKIDPRLAKFLLLKERGLPTHVYPDILVLSYFHDWVVREGRLDGRNVRLFGKDDPFVRLFKAELSQPGSGEDIVNEDDTVTPTSVLDSEGNPVRPFPICKHMTIFSGLYLHKRKVSGKTYQDVRDTVTGDEYNSLVPIFEKERLFLTTTLKDARTKYKTANTNYNNLLSKENDAKMLGDSSFRVSLMNAKRQLDAATREYKQVLESNHLTHKL